MCVCVCVNMGANHEREATDSERAAAHPARHTRPLIQTAAMGRLEDSTIMWCATASTVAHYLNIRVLHGERELP